MLANKNVRNYYIEKFQKILLTDLNATWVQSQVKTQINHREIKRSAPAVD